MPDWDAGKLEEYRAYWRQRKARYEAGLAIRRAEGRRLARQCAELLAARYGVKRVVLIGSLSGQGNKVHERSDIDLVAEGLPNDRYFSALNALCHSVPAGWKLDLIPWEDADPLLRSAAEKGETLYAQPLQNPSERAGT